MNVIKRDGTQVRFDSNKIVKAVTAAFKDVDGVINDYAIEKANNIADYVEKKAYEADHVLTINEIQDFVEHGLMSTKRKDVATAYITYRHDRDRARNLSTSLFQQISKNLNAEDVQNSNANMDEHSFGGRKGEAANTLLKQFALDYCMSAKTRENHLKNRIYIHDLDSYALGEHNCLSVPFDDLLANGFNTRQTDVRPANSINTAFQLVAVIFQLQSLQQFGGVSATHLDWTMVPYVRKSFYKHWVDGLKYVENQHPATVIPTIDNWGSIDNIPIDNIFYQKGQYPKAYQYALDMTIKETQQAVEGMYHNLNTLQSRSGNQLKRMAG